MTLRKIEDPYPGYLRRQIPTFITIDTQGYVQCREQWDEVFDLDIASGPEGGRIEGGNCKTIRIISVDASDNTDRFYATFIPTGLETDVPITTFNFENNDGVINWHSHCGRMEILECGVFYSPCAQ